MLGSNDHVLETDPCHVSVDDYKAVMTQMTKMRAMAAVAARSARAVQHHSRWAQRRWRSAGEWWAPTIERTSSKRTSSSPEAPTNRDVANAVLPSLAQVRPAAPQQRSDRACRAAARPAPIDSTEPIAAPVHRAQPIAAEAQQCSVFEWNRPIELDASPAASARRRRLPSCSWTASMLASQRCCCCCCAVRPERWLVQQSERQRPSPSQSRRTPRAGSSQQGDPAGCCDRDRARITFLTR